MATFRSEVDPTMLLRLYGIGGDVHITGADVTTIEINGDADLDQYVRPEGKTLTINGYPTSLRVTVPQRASVELRGIGSDVDVRAVADVGAHALAKLTAHGVGGDVRAAQVTEIDLEAIGGDALIEAGCETATIGRIGGDLRVAQARRLSLKAVGGNAQLDAISTLQSIGHIGGDLQLSWGSAASTEATAEAGSTEGGSTEVRGTIGGSATLRLPQQPNLAVAVITGGGIVGDGEGWNARHGAGRHRLVFGNGQVELNLTVGSKLRIEGGTQPEYSGTFSNFPWSAGDWGRSWGDMAGFGEEMRGMGRELEELGRKLAQDLSGLGRDIAREVRVAARDARREGAAEWNFERGRRPHVRVRLNEREYTFDPEQIERIKREARAAAAGGIGKAQEAVERALQQLQQNLNQPGRTTTESGRQRSGYTGQTVRIDRESSDAATATSPTAATTEAAPAQTTAAPRDIDAERLAILRMVHEGRLAPDEAEMLLRGLDKQSS